MGTVAAFSKSPPQPGQGAFEGSSLTPHSHPRAALSPAEAPSQPRFLLPHSPRGRNRANWAGGAGKRVLAPHGEGGGGPSHSSARVPRGCGGSAGARCWGCPHQLHFGPFPWVIFAPPLTHKRRPRSAVAR